MELADLPKHFLSRSGAQCVWVAGEGAGHGKPDFNQECHSRVYAWSVGKTDGSSICSGLFSCFSRDLRSWLQGIRKVLSLQLSFEGSGMRFLSKARIFVVSAPVPVLGLISCVCRDRRRHQGIRTGVPAVDVRGFRIAWSVGRTDLCIL